MYNILSNIRLSKTVEYNLNLSNLKKKISLKIYNSGALEWRKAERKYVGTISISVEWYYHNRYGYAIIVPHHAKEYYVNGIRYNTYLEYIVASEEYNEIFC